jgi:hypothetical protein
VQQVRGSTTNGRLEWAKRVALTVLYVHQNLDTRHFVIVIHNNINDCILASNDRCCSDGT